MLLLLHNSYKAKFWQKKNTTNQIFINILFASFQRFCQALVCLLNGIIKANQEVITILQQKGFTEVLIIGEEQQIVGGDLFQVQVQIQIQVQVQLLRLIIVKTVLVTPNGRIFTPITKRSQFFI